MAKDDIDDKVRKNERLLKDLEEKITEVLITIK